MDYTQYSMFGWLPPRFSVIIDIGFPVLGLFGTVGNVLSIVVWTRPQMKSSSAIMLTVLAVCDLIILLSTLFFSFFSTVVIYDLTYFAHNKLISYVYHYILPSAHVWLSTVYIMTKTATIYLTLAITVERYIAVCYPFSYQNICSYSRACKSTAIILTLSVLFNIINFWALKVDEIDLHNEPFRKYYITVSREVIPGSLMDFYKKWLCLFLLYVIPLASMTVCNTAVCIKLMMASRERQRPTDFHKKEFRLTMMLVYVVIEFIVCSSFSVFLSIVVAFDIDMNYTLILLAKPVIDFLEIFNSSINFVTYVTIGERFRKTFVTTFCCCTESCHQRRRSVSRNRRANLDRAINADGVHMTITSD